jgi:hypothetical protein
MILVRRRRRRLGRRISGARNLEGEDIEYKLDECVCGGDTTCSIQFKLEAKLVGIFTLFVNNLDLRASALW